MSLGMVGIKRGMTRIFSEDGVSTPVTVIEMLPTYVSQLKTQENDGYRAIQVTAGSKKASRVNKPLSAHFAKARVEAGLVICEFRLADDELPEIKASDELVMDYLAEGDFVDVRSVSKGKGFAGVIKRHNFSMQDATHGNSLSHRAPGSIGQCQTPGRVFKGKKMAGQMGNVNCSVQNQIVVRVDADKKCFLVKGGVPGAPGGFVFLSRSIKSKGEKK
jgi:large subunit ribosomal protein L3